MIQDSLYPTRQHMIWQVCFIETCVHMKEKQGDKRKVCFQTTAKKFSHSLPLFLLRKKRWCESLWKIIPLTTPISPHPLPHNSKHTYTHKHTHTHTHTHSHTKNSAPKIQDGRFCRDGFIYNNVILTFSGKYSKLQKRQIQIGAVKHLKTVFIFFNYLIKQKTVITESIGARC